MKHLLSAVVVGALVLVVGCEREVQPAPAPAPTAAPATPAATDSAAIQQPASPAPAAALDTKALAGAFSAPGIQLQLLADGGYSLRVRAESAGADLDSAGTWTADADGRHILLDPHSKAEPDRRYEVASMDELRATDGGQALHRDGAAR